jgi:ATP-binding cassette subfamily B multidrug efflux pump
MMKNYFKKKVALILNPATPETKKPWTYVVKRLWKYLAQYQWLLIVALVLTIASNLFALMGPLLSGYAIDAIEPGLANVDFTTVFRYCLLMLFFYVASSVMSYTLSLLLIKLSRKVIYQMRKDVFSKLVSLPVGFFDRHQTGDVISIISYDIDTINASLSSDLFQIVTSIITVIGSLVMMLTISPQLVLIFVVTIPLSVFLTRFIAQRVQPLYRKRSKKLGELNGFIEEITGGQKTAKAYHQEQTFINRFDVKNKEAVDAYFAADYYGSITGPSVNFVNNLSLALVSIFGALLYMAGGISLGSVSSFVLYSRKFSGPINEFANILNELQSAFAATERVFRLLDELPEPADMPLAFPLENIAGKVTMEEVTFGYEPGKTIIHDLQLVATPGSVVAIVGPTGAGKTTIINLLMRFYDIEHGKILIDEQAIQDVTRKSLRLLYTMVLQDTWLFYGTIYDNIAYGKEGVTKAEVIEAAKAAKIDHFIMSLPLGYDTILSDNAINISKGQKQLMTIARAMLLDSKMLILDEATSNVDTQTERRIQSAMLKLMEDRTCFVIAHRLSTIRNADVILVVRDGRIVEQGTHDELIQGKGFYYEMYLSQQNEY